MRLYKISDQVEKISYVVTLDDDFLREDLDSVNADGGPKNEPQEPPEALKDDPPKDAKEPQKALEVPPYAHDSTTGVSSPSAPTVASHDNVDATGAARNAAGQDNLDATGAAEAANQDNVDAEMITGTESSLQSEQRIGGNAVIIDVPMSGCNKDGPNRAQNSIEAYKRF